MENILKNKKGMSLVELIIASVIVTLLLGAISVVAFRSFYLNRYLLEQGLNNSALRNSLRAIERDLREAKQADSGSYMIQSADDFELVFLLMLIMTQSQRECTIILKIISLRKESQNQQAFPWNIQLEMKQ